MKCRAQEPSAQSLLEFMDVASDAVKCALRKPTTFKRNINHRRYLQRQVKTVVRNRRNQRKINPCDLREDVQDLVREAIKELRFSQCYTNAFGMTASHDIRRGPPPQAVHANFLSPVNNPTYPLTHLPLPRPTINYQLYQNPLPQDHQPYLHSEVDLGSHAEDDQFMSGEELTNNIDINDLYIPELHEPRSPIVKCEDYFVENDLEIPSPMYNEQPSLRFQFDPCVNLENFEQFL